MTGDSHPLSQVETVGLEALYPRVQLEHVALLLPGVFHQPIEQLIAIAARSRAGVGDEIIDIEIAAITQVLGDPEAGHSLDLAMVL